MTYIVGRLGIGRQLSSNRGGEGGDTVRGGDLGSAVNPPAQRVPPTLVDIHARLSGSDRYVASTKQHEVGGGGRRGPRKQDRNNRTRGKPSL